MNRSIRLLQKVVLLLVPVALMVSQGGCRRKPPALPAAPVAEESPAPAPQSPAATQPGTASSPPAAQRVEPVPDRLPTAPNDSSARLPIQQELTSAVHLYLTDYQKLPPDFATLVKGKYLPAMPKPPPGKRFALDRNRMQVVIMD